MNDKFTLITGGTEGIGFELSKLFARDKHNLIIIARNEEKLKETRDYLKEEYHIRVEILAVDLSVDNACEKVYAFVEKNNYHVDNLINNAGIGSFGYFNNMDINHEESLIDINIKALTKLTKYFLKYMIDSKKGMILNVASTAAFSAGPKMSIYNASKAYVLSLTEALHEEVKEYGVKVSCLCPGAVKTNFQKKSGIKKNPRAKALLMNAEEVALAGYKGLLKGKAIIIPGFKNKALVFGNKLLPRSISRKIVFKSNQ